MHSPDDLAGVPIRFPNSPAFLANAEALGVTNPVSVAVEEVYTALQQGIAVGQENPIVATQSSSYFEVLNTAILNNHNVGIHWIIVSDATYDKLSEEQAALLDQTIHDIRPDNRVCVEEATEEILDGYRDDPNFTVIETDDIDMDAFIGQAEYVLRGPLHGRVARLLRGDPRDGGLTSADAVITGWVRSHPPRSLCAVRAADSDRIAG